MIKEEIFDIKEIACYLKCSVSTIRNLVKNNKIPNFRVGAKIYFRHSSIERWIEENEK